MDTFSYFLNQSDYIHIYLNNGIIFNRVYSSTTSTWTAIISSSNNLNNHIRTYFSELIDSSTPIDLVLNSNYSEAYRWIGECGSFSIEIRESDLESCSGSWYLINDDGKIIVTTPEPRQFISSAGKQFAATPLESYRLPNHPREIARYVKTSIDEPISSGLTLRRAFNSDSFLRRRVYSSHSTLISSSSKENSILKRTFNPELSQFDVGKNWKPNIPTPFRYLVFNETGHYYDSYNGLCYDADGMLSIECPVIDWADLNSCVDLKTSYWSPIIESHDPSSKDPITFGYNPIANQEELIRGEEAFKDINEVDEEALEEQGIGVITTGYKSIIPGTEEHIHNFMFFTTSPYYHYYCFFDGENIFIKSPNPTTGGYTTIPIQRTGSYALTIFKDESYDYLISSLTRNNMIGFFIVNRKNQHYFWESDIEIDPLNIPKYSDMRGVWKPFFGRYYFNGERELDLSSFVYARVTDVVIPESTNPQVTFIGFYIFIRNLENNEVFYRVVNLIEGVGSICLGSLVDSPVLDFVKSVLPLDSVGDYFISATFNYIVKWEFKSYPGLIIPENTEFMSDDIDAGDVLENLVYTMSFVANIDGEKTIIPFTDGHWDVVYTNYTDIGVINLPEINYNKEAFNGVPISGMYSNGSWCSGAILPRVVGYDNIYLDRRYLSKYIVISVSTSTSKTTIRQEDDIPYSLDSDVDIQVYDRYGQYNVYGFATKSSKTTSIEMYDEKTGYCLRGVTSNINSSILPPKVTNYINNKFETDSGSLNDPNRFIHTSISNNDWTTRKSRYVFLYDKESKLFYQVIKHDSLGEYCIPIVKDWIPYFLTDEESFTRSPQSFNFENSGDASNIYNYHFVNNFLVL